jgi:hypothetical protein
LICSSEKPASVRYWTTYLQKKPVSPAPMQPFGIRTSGSAMPSGAAVAWRAWASSIMPCWRICSITRLRRWVAVSGFCTGSNWVVERTMPASNAACGTVSLSGVVLK